ncbi:hypothetical protein PINS_up012315 [Pythium insidiosum]|nr:hypothetical protein PINS_up012315 [Pythium insidiosum]
MTDVGDSSRDATPALRRSKRESAGAKRVVDADDAAAVVPETPSAAPQRRSQRSTRSALASPETPSKSSPPLPPPTTQATDEPATAVAPSSLSPRSSPLRRLRRVPTRRAAMRTDAEAAPVAGDRQSDPSAAEPPKDGALPGGRSAREAAVLCDVIWQHLKENACQPDALELDVSPAVIRWPRVAERLSRAAGVQWTARECQSLWKFLAYGEQQTEATDQSETADAGALLPDSDVEDYELSAQDINRRVRERSTSQSEKKTVDEERAASTMEEPPSSVSTRDTKDVAGIALYPSYSQPPGVPTEWQQPFDLKRTTPLVFVAEKLLKRRVPLSDESNGVPEFVPGPVELDATQRAMAAELRLSTEKPLPKAKRERKRKSEGAAERPRKKKDATPRPVFVPSSTPPPTPQPARDAFSYYCQMFRENHPAVVPSIDGSSASGDSESPQSLLSVDSLQILYARAATHVQAACEQMAKTDLERYNREVLRVRLWEKTMASRQNSPATASSASKPTEATTTAQITDATVAPTATATVTATVTQPTPPKS